jgi:hypothetical protein
MPEVQEFMRTCIEKNKTDFFLTMCTNGVKISDEFLELLGHFPNTNFSFSIDGYDKVNDYWRSGSKWDRVIDNVYRDECPSVYHRTGGLKSSTAPEPTSLLTCSVITDMMFSLSLLALRGTKTILSQMRGSLLVLMHRRGDLTAWKAHKIQR